MQEGHALQRHPAVLQQAGRHHGSRVVLGEASRRHIVQHETVILRIKLSPVEPDQRRLEAGTIAYPELSQYLVNTMSKV